MTVRMREDQVLLMLYWSFFSLQANIPIQFISVLKDLGDFLLFWWLLIIFFSLFHGVKKCRCFSKDNKFHGCYSQLSGMFCLHDFLWHSIITLQSHSIMVTSSRAPKHYPNFTTHSPFNFVSYLWIIPLYIMSKEQSFPTTSDYPPFHIVKLLRLNFLAKMYKHGDILSPLELIASTFNCFSLM